MATRIARVIVIQHCHHCQYFGSRKSVELGMSEAYCNHDSLEPGEGAMGVKYSHKVVPPYWCRLAIVEKRNIIVPSGRKPREEWYRRADSVAVDL